ncbi:hypothetical protein NL676_006093 [Syzygium grande]|nr:hypothetical protein NL676_006093 [Syzygium grande]
MPRLVWEELDQSSGDHKGGNEESKSAEEEEKREASVKVGRPDTESDLKGGELHFEDATCDSASSDEREAEPRRRRGTSAGNRHSVSRNTANCIYLR